MNLADVYGGKRVFITGHTGFKGSWLVAMLEMLGADIKGYALPPATPNDLYELIKGDRICQSVIGDIREKEKLVAEIKAYRPHFIFHLAAQPLVRLSYAIPAETFAVNAIGTANLLEGVRELNDPCSTVLITTDKVYHNYEWVYPYRETDRLGGYDPYSASKACAELIIDSYRNSFFSGRAGTVQQKGIAVARAGNVIGGGDWSADRLMPDIARALGSGATVHIRNPLSVRPWQHVLEPLAGYLLLGAYLNDNPAKYSGPYNFGPDGADTLSVETMVKMAVGKWGSGSYKVEQRPNELHEAGLLKLDINKANAELNWKPKLTAEKAIDLTIAWYKQFFVDPKLIRQKTLDQIKCFLITNHG